MCPTVFISPISRHSNLEIDRIWTFFEIELYVHFLLNLIAITGNFLSWNKFEESKTKIHLFKLYQQKFPSEIICLESAINFWRETSHYLLGTLKRSDNKKTEASSLSISISVIASQHHFASQCPPVIVSMRKFTNSLFYCFRRCKNEKWLNWLHSKNALDYRGAREREIKQVRERKKNGN